MITESEVNSAVYTLLRSKNLEHLNAHSGLIARIRREWNSFKKSAISLGFNPEEHRLTAYNIAEGDLWDHAAHDWILTREGCGCGFWDGDWEKNMGEKLTELSKTFGELDVYSERGYVYSEFPCNINKIATYCFIKYKNFSQRGASLIQFPQKNATSYLVKLPEIDKHWRRINCRCVSIDGGFEFIDWCHVKGEKICLGNILGRIYVPVDDVVKVEL
jgi:hypothetical protein